MEKGKIEQLEKIVKDLELKQVDALNQCREIIRPFCNNGWYYCDCKKTDIKIDELSIDNVKTIIADYDYGIKQEQNYAKDAGQREKLLGLNKYGPDNEYGK